jgi:hypothetical protein
MSHAPVSPCLEPYPTESSHPRLSLRPTASRRSLGPHSRRKVEACGRDFAGLDLRTGKIFARRCKSRGCATCRKIENLKAYTKIVAQVTPFVESGHEVLFATLTMQHPACDSLAAQVESWRQAWDHFTKKGVLTTKRGVAGYVARFEPGEQGDNLHVHILLVIAMDSSATEVERRLRTRWQRSCRRAERSCTKMEFREAGALEANKTFAQYMPKECAFDDWPADRQLGYVKGLRGFRMTRSSLCAPKLCKPKREWFSAQDLDTMLSCGQRALDLVATLSNHLPKLIAWTQEHEQTDLKDKLARFSGWLASTVTTRSDGPLAGTAQSASDRLSPRMDDADAHIADYPIGAALFTPQAIGTGRTASLPIDHRAGASVAARSKLQSTAGDGCPRTGELVSHPC